MIVGDKTVAFPFEKFYKHWENLTNENDAGAIREETYKRKAELLDEVSLQNNVVVFLWHVHQKKFLYMSDKLKVLSGIDSRNYTEGNGLEFSILRIFPGQREACVAFNMLAIELYKNNAQYDIKSLLFCMNFLYCNGNNEYVQVLQRTSVLETDEQGAPLLFISMGHYVGHIKRQDSVAMAFSTPGGVNLYKYDPFLKSCTPPIGISEQEKKVLELLAQGCDTKTIAQKLFISPHTVDTHRRKIIKKTDCQDTTGAVAYAKLINLI